MYISKHLNNLVKGRKSVDHLEKVPKSGHFFLLYIFTDKL